MPFRMPRRPGRSAGCPCHGVRFGGLSGGSDLIEGTHAEFDIGEILFRGLLVVAERKDADRVTLAGTVINEGSRADVLESVSVGPAGYAGTGHPRVELPPDVPVGLGPTGSVQIVLLDPADIYRVGDFVPLTLRLRDAGQITHQVLVEDAADYLAPVEA